jgi:hypothetical protein
LLTLTGCIEQLIANSRDAPDIRPDNPAGYRILLPGYPAGYRISKIAGYPAKRTDYCISSLKMSTGKGKESLQI